MVLDDKLGVLAGFVSWVNSADSAVHSVEVEVQTFRATTIAVVGSWAPLGDRTRDAWTNDFRPLPVGCNISHPWENLTKLDRLPSPATADAVYSLSG